MNELMNWLIDFALNFHTSYITWQVVMYFCTLQWFWWYDLGQDYRRQLDFDSFDKK